MRITRESADAFLAQLEPMVEETPPLVFGVVDFVRLATEAATAAVRQILDAPPKPLVETLEPRRLYSA